MNVEQKAVIDRIEDGKHAVLLVGDDETEYVIAVQRLPKGAVAGKWLRVQFEDGEIAEMQVDEEETEKVTERIERKMERLRKKPRRFRPLEEDQP